MRRLYTLVFLLTFTFLGAQVQTSASFTTGDIGTLRSAMPSSTATESTCPDTISIFIPAGNVVLSTSIAYSMTAFSGAWMSEQLSYVECSSTGIREASFASGAGNTNGTMLYNRPAVTIANGVSLTGEIKLVMHAFKTFGNAGCSPVQNKVDNGTWIVTLTHIPPPTCPFPSVLQSLSTSSNSAFLSWVSGGASDWNIQFGAPGFALGTGTIVSANSNNFRLNGLNPQTTYQVYVRDSCSAGDVSAWIGPISLTTTCTPSTAPINQTFDPGAWIPGTGFTNGNDAINSCWERSPGGNTGSFATAQYFWGISTSSAAFNTGPSSDHTSGSGKYFYVESSLGPNGSVADLITRPIDLSPLIVPEMRFWHHMYGAQIGTLNVSVDNGSGWVNVFTITGQQQTASTSPWTEVVIPMASYANDTVKIRFSTNKLGASGDLAIDDLFIDEAPACPQPANLNALAIGSNSVNLDWLAATASSWNLEFGPPGFTPGSGTVVPAGTNPFNLTGLMPNTQYDIYVQENCGAAGLSVFSGPLSIRTNCLPIPAPYLETIDGVSWLVGTGFTNGGNVIDPCWSRDPLAPIGFFGDYAWGTQQGNPGTFSTGPSGDHTTGSGKYVYVESSIGNVNSEAELVTPLIDVSSLTVPELRFWYHMYGASTGSIDVEVNSGSGWVNVWSISGQQQSASAQPWLEAVVGIGSFANDTIQIRFSATRGTGGQGDMGIDDIAVNEAPSCPQPSGNSILSIGSDNATVDWISGGSTNWNVSATAVGGNPLSGIIGNATAIPFTLGGLSPNTSYDIYIRDSCAVGDVSLWIGPITFRTNCLPFPTPFNENFDGISWVSGTGFTNGGDAIDPCFSRDPGPPSGFTGNLFWGAKQGATGSLNTGPSADHTTGGAGKYIYIESTFGTIGATAEFLSPLIDLSSLTVPELRFWYHMFGAQTGTIEVAINDGTGWTSLVSISGQQQTANVDPWLESVIPLSAYVNDTVQIRWTGTRGAGGTGDMSIDDFSIIEAPTCPQPSVPIATTVSFNSADLSWTTGGAADWNISYGPFGFSPNSGTIVSTNTNPFVLSGLNPSTQYHLYIRDSCGPGSVSLWVGPITIATLCGPVPAPYIQNFTSTLPGITGASPAILLQNCWALGASNAFMWETENSTGANENSFNTGPWFDNTTPSSPGGMYVFVEASSGAFGSVAPLTSPLIIINSLTTPNLSFAYHMYGTSIDSLRVDVFGNGVWNNNVWSLFGPQQASGGAAWLKANVPLSAFGDTIQVRFNGRKGNGFQGDIALDDISIDEAPACPDPSALAFLTASTTIGTVFWNAGSITSTSWNIEYGPTGFTPGTGTIFPATNDTTTITGLNPSTSYDVYVTEVCPSGTGFSGQLGPINFNTLCVTATIPYLRDFNTWPPVCWDLTGGSETATQTNGNYLLGNYWNWNATDFALATTEPIAISVDARVRFRWSHLFNGGFGANDQLILHVRLASGTTWDTLIDLIGPTFTTPGAANTNPAPDANFIQESIALDPALYTGQDVVFQLVLNSGFGTDLFVDDFIVEELPNCLEPTIPIVLSSTANSAALSWTPAVATANTWFIEYGPVGFIPGTGTLVTASAIPFTLTGLTPSSSYSFVVRELCSNGIDTSAYSVSTDFSTLCTAFASPYSENFDGATWVTGTGLTNTNDIIDNCWIRNPDGNSTGGPNVYSWGTGTGPTASGGTGPTVDNTTGTGNYAYIEASGGGNSDRAILETPLIDLTGLTNPELEFYYHMFGPSIDSLVIKVNDGTTVTTLDFLVGAQQGAQADPWLMRTISLVPYAGNTISIRFESRKLGFGGDISIDDVSFQSGSVCPSPFNLLVSNTGPGSVDLSWTSGGVAGFSQIEYGPVGFAPGTGSIFNATGTTASITGLTASTSYDFYVTDSCGAASFSSQIGPIGATTQCVALVAPYIEDFENASWTSGGTFDPGTIDVCWTRDNTANYWWKGNSGATPTVNTGPNGDHTTGTGNYMYTETNSNSDLNTEILSPSIDVSALTSPELRFWYHMYGSLIDELELEVWDGSVWTSELSLVSQQQASQPDPWQESVIDLSAYTGIIQLRFTANRTAGANNQVDISIDDIAIDEALSCPNPTALTLTANVTTTSVELSWTSGGAASWQIEYGPIGFIPGTGTVVNAISNPFVVTGLSPSSSYHFYVRDSCAVGSVSPWSGPLVGSTQCGIAIAPYFENFDLTFAEGAGVDNTGSTIDPCWTRNPATGYHWGGGQGGTPTGGTGPTADHTSGFGNYVYAEASFTTPGLNAELETPDVDVSALTLPELRFWYHMDGANMGKVRIDVNDGTSWTAVDSIIGTQGAAWLERRVVLTAFVNQTIKVRFVSTTGTTPTQLGDIAIDDLSIIEAPTCFAPTSLQLNATGVSTADLSWITGGTTNWQIEYGSAGFTPGTGTIVTAGSNPFTVTGLNPGTLYEFYVRDSCGTADVSNWEGPVSGITLCTAFAAPYSENFDGATWVTGTGLTNTNDIIDNCWIRNPDGNSTGGPNVYSWGTGTGPTASGGTGPTVDNTTGTGNYAYIEASGGGNSDRAILETPLIDLTGLTNPELEFYYHMFGPSIDSLVIKVNDGTTVTTLDFLVGAQQGAQADPWLMRTISLVPYAGNTISIRFESRKLGFGGDISIDDVSFQSGSVCPSPFNLLVSNTGPGSVDLSWTSGGVAGFSQIEYGPVGFAPGTGSIFNATGTTASITGLTASTSYDFYVTDSCGAASFSSQIGPIGATTQCVALVAPYIEDFENASWTSGGTFDPGTIDVCWTRDNTANYWWKGNSGATPTVNTGPNGDHTTGTGNYMYTETNSNSDLNTEILSPSIDVSALTSPELRFWYHMYGSLIDELELEVWDGSVWTSELSLVSQQQASQPDPWQESVIDLSAYTGIIQLRFTANRTAGANNQVDISIDDIAIDEALSCPNPTALTLTANVTTTSVELSWTSGGAASWQIEYGPIGFIPGTGTVVNAISNPFVVTGLSPSSSYHFYVRDSCAVGSVSPWSGPLVGSTQCGIAIAPYFENFDLTFAEGAGVDNTGSTIDPCWTRNPATGYHWGGGQGGTPTGGTGPTADHTSGFGNYVYAEASFTTPGLNAELETPDVDVSALTLPELRFWYHMDGANMGKVRIDVNDGTSWTAVDSIIGTQGAAWLERRVVLTAFVNQTIKVRFVSTTGTTPTQLGDIAIDDLSIVEGPTCFVPTNLSITASTTNSVSLSWTSGGATNWQIEYGPVGFTPGTGTIVNTTSNPFIITGLNPSSAFDFIVRDSCGAADVSQWSTAIQGTTGCATVIAPYTENFDSQFLEGTGNTNAGSTINPCWTRSTTTGYHWGGGQGTTPTGTTGPSGDHTSGNGNYVYVEASFSTVGLRADLETPDIDLSALTFPELSFWYHMLGNSFGALRIDIFDGTAWNIGVDSIVGTQGNAWFQRNVNLAAFANQTIKVRFVSRVVSTPGQFGDVAIDDLVVDEGPSCPPPSSLVASAVSSNSVTLQWASGGAANWQVEYGPVGFIPGTGTIVSVTSNPFTLTGLAVTTAYDIYLRDSCGTADVSAWIGPLNITTVNCANGCFLTLELADTFGDGWTGNGAGTTFHELEFSFAGGTPVVYTLPAGNSATFQIPVCDNDPFTVSFVNGGQWPDECSFRLRDPNNVLIYEALAGSLNASSLLYTDTVDCGGPQQCADPTALGVQNVGQNSVNLIWTSNSGTSRVEFGLAGFALGTGQFIGFIPSTPFNLTGLTPSTNYQYYVQDSCGPGSTSNWVGPFSFSTTNCPAVTANFTFTISNLSVTVDGTSSSGSFFSWSFGTTGTSFDSTTTYTFGQEGTYVIKLVNSSGCGSLDSMLVTVDLCSPLSAVFSQTTNLLDADFDATTSGGIPTSFGWDFGDGNSGTGILPSHTYASSGIYTVLLTLTNACNQTDTISQTIEVCDTVQANFTYTFNGTTFVFDPSSSSANASSWAWDFGDGTIDSIATPTHTFISGTFNVQLIVTNNCGDDDTVSIPVVVCAKPTASWNFTIISSGVNGMQIQFDASASIGAVTYDWDFGDGSGNTTSGFPVHTYATPGLFYIVRLIVYNSCGDSDTLLSALSSIGLDQNMGQSESLALFPNPSTDKVQVDWMGLSSSEEVSVELIDAAGKIVSSPKGTLETGEWHLELNIVDLPKGTYYLHLRQGSKSRIKRFVKQ